MCAITAPSTASCLTCKRTANNCKLWKWLLEWLDSLIMKRCFIYETTPPPWEWQCKKVFQFCLEYSPELLNEQYEFLRGSSTYQPEGSFSLLAVCKALSSPSVRSMEEKEINFPSEKHEMVLDQMLLLCVPRSTNLGLTENSPFPESAPQEVQVLWVWSALSPHPDAGFLLPVSCTNLGVLFI